ncbi:Bacitracin export ATP-binding protein BceA [Streptomyces sp. S4.7]|nr:Bacitracin export ATP-binding protein BceA [Streptomyces sp. S4.7]
MWSRARDVLLLLQQTVRVHGRTVVMVTHDPVAASYADTVIFLADGRLAGHIDHPTVDTVAERLAHLGDTLHGTVAAGCEPCRAGTGRRVPRGPAVGAVDRTV